MSFEKQIDCSRFKLRFPKAQIISKIWEYRNLRKKMGKKFPSLIQDQDNLTNQKYNMMEPDDSESSFSDDQTEIVSDIPDSFRFFRKNMFGRNMQEIFHQEKKLNPLAMDLNLDPKVQYRRARNNVAHDFLMVFIRDNHLDMFLNEPEEDYIEEEGKKKKKKNKKKNKKKKTKEKTSTVPNLEINPSPNMSNISELSSPQEKKEATVTSLSVSGKTKLFFVSYMGERLLRRVQPKGYSSYLYE